MARKPIAKAEHGDFQTPAELARSVCRLVRVRPATVVEPTCGVGSFLLAARETFGSGPALVGLEINSDYLAQAREALVAAGGAGKVTLKQADFFGFDWRSLLDGLDAPILVVGNPPWVTSSELGALSSANLPEKSNFQGHRGLDAITGQSNFDISEWMGLRLLEELSGRDATIALLLKVAVARKLLRQAWSTNLPIRDALIRPINAMNHFGAAVEACLLSCRTDKPGEQRAAVFKSLDSDVVSSRIGFRDGELVADIDAYERTRPLRGTGTKSWRSGIKHDAAKVFELKERAGRLINGLGEEVEVEESLLYPLLKSSDVAKGVQNAGRWLLVPQRATGEDTHKLRLTAPKAWEYLNRHADRLAKRKSSIYQNRPPFAIFGVGPYTFAPWKVAISGLYKRLSFVLVPPLGERPVVFDDTVYFLSYESQDEARVTAELLSCPLAADFFSAAMFWDAKRPITAKLLRQLDIPRLADALGVSLRNDKPARR